MVKRILAALTALAIMGAVSTSAADNPRVKLTTNYGSFTVELYPDKAPGTVKNFLQYVNSGHYNGTIFHRVIRGFMIQGGGMEPGMKNVPSRDPIKNEADNGLRNDAGTIAMARTGDPHSATDQFFINVVDNDPLNHTARNARGWGYTVFGKVTEGMDTVRKIEMVPTRKSGQMEDVPVKDVIIEKAAVVQ
ncbi:MAG: peptidylprolyl isomerase [Alphaproteobacteria bacterium]|nr:peptidylprolyl isomerase [Alphaproteobacteria bacterium]